MPAFLQTIVDKLKLAWVWVKGHWWLLVGALVLLLTAIFSGQRAMMLGEITKQLRDQQEQNRRELEALRNLQEEQRVRQEEINRTYREVVTRIETDYKEKIQALSRRDQEELKNLIARTKDNPEAMAREINSLFGLPIYTIPTGPGTS